MITVIFTAVIATFFIAMAFGINVIVDKIRNLGGTFRHKKESVSAGEAIEEIVESDQKGHVSTGVEPVARRPWSVIRGRHKEQQSPA